MRKQDTIDYAMRVLWALVERQGGTITVTDKEAGPVTGAMNISWDAGEITVSIAAGHSAVKQ